MTIRTGQCLCGRVQYNVRGEPLRVGICHCMDCRRESGAVFTTFESEAEIRIGSLDVAPTGLKPTHELWIKRREHWLAPLTGCQQFENDRPK